MAGIRSAVIFSAKPVHPATATWQQGDPLLQADLLREWQLRRWALDPAGTNWEWQEYLKTGVLVPGGATQSPWVRSFDVAEAFGRSPESALRPGGIGSSRGGGPGVLSRAKAADYPPLLAAQDAIQRKVNGQRLDDFPFAHILPESIHSMNAVGLGSLLLLCEHQMIGSPIPEPIADRELGIKNLLGTDRILDDAEWERTLPYLHTYAAEWQRVEAAFFLDGEGKVLVERLQGAQPSLLASSLGSEFVTYLRFLARQEAPGSLEAKFTMETILLSQRCIDNVPVGSVTGYPLSMDWRVLEEGLRTWSAGGIALTPDRITRRQSFIRQVARLGDPELGELFWRIALDPEGHLLAEDRSALGGRLLTQQLFIGWACESLDVSELLNRALQLSPEEAQWVFDGLLLRMKYAHPSDLVPWLDGGRERALRMGALAALEDLPDSPEVRKLWLELVDDRELEVARRAFRASTAWKLSADEKEHLYAAWSEWEWGDRLTLLRELPPLELNARFVDDCAGALERGDVIAAALIDAVAHAAPNSERWGVLVNGLQREFDSNQRNWGQGLERPVNRLARWVQAAARMDRQALTEVLGPLFLTRIGWLQTTQAERTYLEFCKASLAAFGASPTGRAWLREQITSCGTWPRRLRVELALQLAAHSSEEAMPIDEWLRSVDETDYPRLGGILRERWLQALGERPGPVYARILEEAGRLRSSGTLRRTAMRVLVARGEIDPVITVLENERVGEGVRIAGEVLRTSQDSRIPKALRARIEKAAKVIRAAHHRAELAEEMLTPLQVLLVQGGHWSVEDEPLAMLVPNLFAEESALARMQGQGTTERWPAEIALVGALAEEGLLVGLTERAPDLFLRLPGPLLARMALQADFKGGPENATWLARAAELALAGEAPGQEWMHSKVEMDWLRLRIARKSNDWPLVRWYSLEIARHYRGGGKAKKWLATLIGEHDLRTGTAPLAWLSALWWQAHAYEALADEIESSDNSYVLIPPDPKASAARAADLLGGSKYARQEQERLQEALDRK